MVFLKSFAAFLLLLTACGWTTPVQAREQLTVCFNEMDVRPWHTTAGKGLYFDLLGRVAKRADIEFKFTPLPWKRCQALVKANQVNGIMAVSFHEDRVDLGAFPGGLPPDASKRLQTHRYVLVKRRDAPTQWDGKAFSRLEGPIGAKLGYSIGDFLKGLGAEVDASHRNVGELMRRVIVGTLNQAALLETEVNGFLLAEPGSAAKLEILPQPLVEKPYFLVLSKQFAAAHPETATRIWQAIEDVRNSSEYRRIEKDALDKTTY